MVRVLRTSMLLVFSLLLLAGMASAQTKPKVTRLKAEPQSILYVGNSFFYFNNGIDGPVFSMHAEAEPDKPLGGAMVTIASAGLKWHDFESYFRPDGLNTYDRKPDGTVVFKDTTTGPKFDTVVMMDCSYCTIEPELRKTFFEYTRRYSEISRRHGAEPVFLMTWAYASQPEMMTTIAESYTKAGNDNNALIIPVGLAFARVQRDRPDIQLLIFDKQHPTLAGSYLAACTVYSALFGRSPAGLKFYNNVPHSIARRLQEAAWATVQEYYGR